MSKKFFFAFSNSAQKFFTKFPRRMMKFTSEILSQLSSSKFALQTSLFTVLSHCIAKALKNSPRFSKIAFDFFSRRQI